ncbi:hypothetical protein [Bradyrhizobium sp.]|uniref:hypothetical protein n=1 Tax=Bradyrhizobium sp. TaxID=376 RepID=UPI0026350F61|nr:hypothetical protein [Bradyrhizobium sp.]
MKRPFGLVAACVLASAVLGRLHAATNLAPGPGDTRLHLEACTKWTEQQGSFTFTNECSEPVALVFVELGGLRRFDRVIKPKERFDIKLPEQVINMTSWLFTACPAGYVPSVPFTVEEQALIVAGQYECIRRRGASRW